jgi:hypothetical protein
VRENKQMGATKWSPETVSVNAGRPHVFDLMPRVARRPRGLTSGETSAGMSSPAHQVTPQVAVFGGENRYFPLLSAPDDKSGGFGMRLPVKGGWGSTTVTDLGKRFGGLPLNVLRFP